MRLPLLPWRNGSMSRRSLGAIQRRLFRARRSPFTGRGHAVGQFAAADSGGFAALAAELSAVMPQGRRVRMRFENIEYLMKGHGDSTLGRIGPIRCAATATCDGNTLAMLVRRPRESFMTFLARLEGAIGMAMEQEE